MSSESELFVANGGAHVNVYSKSFYVFKWSEDLQFMGIEWKKTLTFNG